MKSQDAESSFLGGNAAPLLIYLYIWMDYLKKILTKCLLYSAPPLKKKFIMD